MDAEPASVKLPRRALAVGLVAVASVLAFLAVLAIWVKEEAPATSDD